MVELCALRAPGVCGVIKVRAKQETYNDKHKTESDAWLYLGSGGDGEHKSGHSGAAEIQQTTLEKKKRRKGLARKTKLRI